MVGERAGKNPVSRLYLTPDEHEVGYMQNWGVWGERNSVYLRDVGRFLEGQHGTAGGGDDHHPPVNSLCSQLAAFNLSSCTWCLHVAVYAGADVGGEKRLWKRNGRLKARNAWDVV